MSGVQRKSDLADTWLRPCCPCCRCRNWSLAFGLVALVYSPAPSKWPAKGHSQSHVAMFIK